MKNTSNTMRTLRLGAVMVAGLFSAANIPAQSSGQWDFNQSNLVATVGSTLGDLQYSDGPGAVTQDGTIFGTTASFGLPSINGTNAVVMKFPASTNGMGYNLPTPPPNGRGSFVDNYTLILDLLYPAASNLRLRPILETDGDLIVGGIGADLAIGTNNGVGLTSGTFDGLVSSSTWYRIGFVVSTNQVRTYINGVQVGSQSAKPDRLALSPNTTALLLANLGANPAADGYVNSLQLRDAALTSDQMQALGGPSAAGIPLTIPSIPSYVVSWTPPGAASSAVTDLGVVINPGEASVNTNSIVLKLNNVAQTGVSVSSNGVITVLKSAAGLLTPGTTYTLEISYADSQAGAKSFSKQFKAALLFEDFEELTLGTNFDEGLRTQIPAGGPTNYAHVWTKTPPVGWVIDDSHMPNYVLGYANYADTNVATGAIYNDGVGEWNGWSFADKTVFWGVQTDNQNRQLFTYGKGTVAVADPDEWDDDAHPKFDANGYALYFNSYLSTRPINVTGLPVNSIYMNFDSSWRPEGADDWGGTNNQTALITASYNGGAAKQVLRWESIAGPNYHPDAVNEKVSVLLQNPAGATNLVVTFALINAANDWWWAFDNLEINIGDIPSSIVQYVPSQNATNVAPQPALGATIAPGTTAINPASIQFSLDGTSVPVTVTTNTQGQLVLQGRAPSILSNHTMHTNMLTFTDSLSGLKSTNWSFRVDYDEITLGTPVWYENFDGVAEGVLPSGWVATNLTTVGTTNFNLNDPNSAAYQDWVVLSTNRLGSVFNGRRFNVRPTTLNGEVVQALMAGNLVYAESDNRSGSQVQVLFSPVVNLTGITSVKLAFNSIYEQNQDSMGAVEYSIDGGATWLPALYMLKNQTNDDLVFTSDVLDPVATFGTVRSDQAWATNFSAFIGATVDASFGPYISGRVDDDATESKRIEVLALPLADNQPSVRLRFLQTGTASWYFGIDNLGFYGNGATNVPVRITNQPTSRIVFIGQATVLTAGVDPYSTRPLTFQWQKFGTNLTAATSQMLTLTNAQLTDTGNYRVIAGSASGSVTSDVAVVTVQNPLPGILAQPMSKLVSVGAPVTISVTATSAIGSLSYQWYKDGSPLAGATNSSVTFAAAQTTNAGTYSVQLVNPAGPTNSANAVLSVFSGSLGSGLVAYLPFDGNYRDYSGRYNHGQPVGSPTFGAGRVGQALRVSVASDLGTNNYVTLGYPADLKFGTGDFSVAFWVNYTNQTSDPAFISNKDWDSSSNPGWGIFAQGGGNFRVNATGTPGGSGNRMSTTYTNLLRDGNWHFVLSTFWRGKYVSTYLDGTLVSTTPLTISGIVDTNLAVNIGQDGTGTYNGTTLDALIDEVMLWNRAITPQEAAQFYNAGVNGSSPIILIGTLMRLGANVTLDWTGGLPPFAVEYKSNLNDVGWTLAGTTTNHSITVTVGSGAAFFQVRGTAP